MTECLKSNTEEEDLKNVLGKKNTSDLELGSLPLGPDPDSIPGTEFDCPYISIEELASQFRELEETENNSLIMKRIRQQIPEEVISNRQKKIQERNLHILRLFNLTEPQNISIEQYLLRFLKYSNSISVLVYIHFAYLIYRL